MFNLIAATLLAFVCGSAAAIATFTTTGETRTADSTRMAWIVISVGTGIAAVLLAIDAHLEMTTRA